jgi:glycosyltransferase involved in cell wall biosynthesis
MKFGIYTSFYNVEKYVDRIFSNVESIQYDNFEWHITDDFSTDNTKSIIFERLEKSPIRNKVLYADQSSKQEMYWKPNLFFDETFDWIVLIDSDDLVDPEFLSIYNDILKNKSDVVIVSSDFHKINDEDNSLHSISYILNDDMMSSKIDKYHPSCDYLNNISYSCFGHLRAFKNNIIENFEITNNLAGAEDSYRIFWLNSHGKYLNIPRPLYKWYLRNDSISHNPNVSSVYNDNFEIAFNRLEKSDYGVDLSFNDVYLETCALGSYTIGELKNKKVSLWTRFLSPIQKNKIKSLYPSVSLFFNDASCDTNIFNLNYFNKDELSLILNKVPKNNVLLYYQNQKYHSDNHQKDNELLSQLAYYKEVMDNYTTYSWWMYIRHFIIKN